MRRVWLPGKWRYRWSIQLRDREFHARLAAAREKNDTDAVAVLLADRSFDEYFDHEESEIAFTKALIERARSLRVPVPEYPAPEQHNEWWYFSAPAGERYLTASGIAELRKSIRREERWLYERRSHWIRWLTAITGLVGALIGLASIMRASSN